jgi:hypothetical protein
MRWRGEGDIQLRDMMAVVLVAVVVVRVVMEWLE